MIPLEPPAFMKKQSPTHRIKLFSNSLQAMQLFSVVLSNKPRVKELARHFRLEFKNAFVELPLPARVAATRGFM
ncbi:MAG: hypothetical protein K8R87_12050 [Verrucomicrobia bacterium]|nr:hypothetical protein [Verrucomicrobiota bacterium]